MRISGALGLVAIAWLAAGAPPGWTQDAPADGRTCFCLQNSQTKQIVRGCTGSRYGQDAYVTASCAAAKSGEDITVAPPWTVVPQGDGRCAPCSTSLPSSQASRALRSASAQPAPPPATPAPGEALQPVRAFARARDIPPKDVGAYGIVAITSLPTPASRERLSRFCTAFIAHLPSQASSVFPRGQQMVTVWPLDDPDAEPAKNNDCGFALDHYDLQAGISAVRDARTQGAGLDGRGPFLLGWSPSVTRGVPDKFVLVVDMSTFETQASFDEALTFWQQKVIQNPELWRSGFAIERLRLSIHDFVDHYGSDILNAVRLFAGKS